MKIKKYNEYLKILEKSNFIISLSTLDDIISNIFNDKKVSSVNTLYEEYDNGYKFILTINNLYYDKTNIIHTKFIFYVDKEKRKLTEKYFHYLYDINCNYKKIKFDYDSGLETEINNILDNRLFGDDIKDISDVSIGLVSNVNEWLVDNNVENLSIYSIQYNPVVDHIPCESMFFQFDINIDDIRFIKMNLKKNDDNDYKLSFSEGDIFKNLTIDDIKSIPQTIGKVVKNNLK